MRSPSEVNDLIDTLERLNQAALREQDDEHFAIFNHNSQLLCALRWVTGEDTIRHSLSRVEAVESVSDPPKGAHTGYYNGSYYGGGHSGSLPEKQGEIPAVDQAARATGAGATVAGKSGPRCPAPGGGV
jgi:hypothetical protein